VQRQLVHQRRIRLRGYRQQLLRRYRCALDLARRDEHVTETGAREGTLQLGDARARSNSEALLVCEACRGIVAVVIVRPADRLERERLATRVADLAPQRERLLEGRNGVLELAVMR
jgi:hypothetical protein